MTIPRKVAVIGAGEIGVGWAALCASAGWPVAIFDLDPSAVERASSEVERRTVDYLDNISTRGSTTEPSVGRKQPYGANNVTAPVQIANQTNVVGNQPPNTFFRTAILARAGQGLFYE